MQTAKVPAETGSAGENAADCGFQCGEAGEVLSDVNVVIDDEASHNCTKLHGNGSIPMKIPFLMG